MRDYQNDIIEEVAKTCLDFKIGGPFGAVIYKYGQIVGKGTNKVIAKHDPTAHAEIEAIRDACINLQTHDLTGCEMYATGYPCPMCMSAIIWANIKKVYYSASYFDTDRIGFKDSKIFNFIQIGCWDKSILDLENVEKDKVLEIYDKFLRQNGQVY